MNASIRFPSSLVDFRRLLRIASTLLFFFRLLTCQTACGTSLRFLLLLTWQKEWLLLHVALKEKAVGAVFEVPVTVPSLVLPLFGFSKLSVVVSSSSPFCVFLLFSNGTSCIVEEAVLTQPSLIESDSVPEFRHSYPLMEDSGVKGDYVLEAAGPSDRISFRASKDGPHFLWVYQELFTRLRMRLPFSDFQRDVMTRCRITVSQLHLNGWGFILAFEKVLAAPGKQAFWLDHENKPFPWVYWNPEVKDFVVFNLEPLEMAAFKFLVSDAEVGKFLDDLLDVKMKRTKLDDLMAKMADPARMGPRPVLPTSSPSATAVAAAAAAASASGTSVPAAAGSPLMESSVQVPLAPAASDAKKAKKQPLKRDRVKVVDSEEELKEDPAADLQSKRKKKKLKIDEAFEKALGDDSAWEHEIDPLRVAFPADFDYRKALNAGLTSAPVREALTKMPLEQLLGESYLMHAKSLACLQVGVETSLAAKIKVEKELSASLDQIEVLKGERDSTLLYLPLREKVGTLEDDLSEKSLQHQSALDRIAQLEEDNKADLSKATKASEYWRSEWHALGSDVTEMCQETLDVCLDQVSHLCLGVDFSAITLKTRWDPKGRRIFVPPEPEVGEELPSAEEVVQEQGPQPAAQTSQPVAGDAGGSGGECPI
ncbi:hypothetical protein PIB30_001489 [Stylosanthes scabra]|uniref:Uncharacterized protein n=1 Tax=Stylosanthes scabra TaxID=79078 RepID=A0ABU6Q3V0_9FABA|nr:hypothetical protein [Stylosanthes scabra]